MNFYNIEALNKYEILIPTTVNPEIVVNILAATLSQEHGIGMDYALKKYNVMIGTAAGYQHDKP